MGRSRESFSKKEVRTKKEKKRKDKFAKKQVRKDPDSKGGLEGMFAYVDEFGQLSSTPMDPSKKIKTKAEDIEISIPKGDSTARNRERTGVITNFYDSKGFGFIRDLQTNESIFVHVNNAEDEIGEGKKVTFETEKGLKGLTAVKVKVVR